MGPTPIRVVLRIVPAVLSSALQQFLAANPHLEVEVGSPVDDTSGGIDPIENDPRRVVVVSLLEDPFRFRFEVGDREWIVAYDGLDDLADRLSWFERPPVDCR
jgi:hypothetical protein